ncbi:MAG TPA: hypothetical protein VEA69_13325 [Tepidisphaeraceae bacterium]|nr:hypothetical protein [Tepidisphaeraceae bacterium]
MTDLEFRILLKSDGGVTIDPHPLDDNAAQNWCRRHNRRLVVSVEVIDCDYPDAQCRVMFHDERAGA